MENIYVQNFIQNSLKSARTENFVADKMAGGRGSAARSSQDTGESKFYFSLKFNFKLSLDLFRVGRWISQSNEISSDFLRLGIDLRSRFYLFIDTAAFTATTVTNCSRLPENRRSRHYHSFWSKPRLFLSAYYRHRRIDPEQETDISRTAASVKFQ